MKKKNKKVMSVLTLVMINFIAIASIRNIPMNAYYGLSLISYYLLGALAFFIPSALVSAELATAWPETGGCYVWVREAFGKPAAFLVAWIQWIYNVCWYPTILSLLAATLAYVISPNLASNVWYTLGIVFIVYWALTFMTMFGMRVSGILSTFAAIFGTLLPMLVVTVLGIAWLITGGKNQIVVSFHNLLPDISNPTNLALLTGVIYGLVGIEMSATHAQEVKNPKTDYPKAIFYSGLLILISTILSSLAVAIVLPAKKLGLVTGLLDAFLLFFKEFHLAWLMPIIAIFIIIGILGGVGAWMIGPVRGLSIAAQDGCIPPFLQKVNGKNIPIAMLIVQGILFSVICFVFIVMPSISSAFWILSDLTAQLAMSSYIFIFAAAIRLRYKHPRVPRAYRVPFGNFGMWAISIIGILMSFVIILIGYLPPTQINIGSLKFYETFLISGFIIFYLLPMIIYVFHRRSWKRRQLLQPDLE